MIKATQELSKTNDSLKEMINNLQSQLNDIQQEIAIMKTGSLVGADGAALRQNAPNPFSTNTIIGYYIPSKAISAQITVTDMNGNLLKTMSVANRGQGQTTIYGGKLSAGVYLYSLMVDGVRVDTKKMVLTK